MWSDAYFLRNMEFIQSFLRIWWTYWLSSEVWPILYTVRSCMQDMLLTKLLLTLAQLILTHQNNSSDITVTCCHFGIAYVLMFDLGFLECTLPHHTILHDLHDKDELLNCTWIYDHVEMHHMRGECRWIPRYSPCVPFAVHRKHWVCIFGCSSTWAQSATFSFHSVSLSHAIEGIITLECDMYGTYYTCFFIGEFMYTLHPQQLLDHITAWPFIKNAPWNASCAPILGSWALLVSEEMSWGP